MGAASSAGAGGAGAPPGSSSRNLAWLLLTFLGIFGIHRMYSGRWVTGFIYLFTLGLFGVGVIYDFWTLNSQISLINHVANKEAG